MKKLLVFLFLFLLCLTVSNSIADAPAGYTHAGKTENCYFYGDNGYTVEYRYDYETMLPERMRGYIDSYNSTLADRNIPVFFYFVNNSRSIDFSKDSSTYNDMYEALMSELTCVDHSSCLSIPDFSTYEALFYQTDHHWNHVGAQKGYEDIIKLIWGEDEPTLQPVEEVDFHTVYNGSYVQRTGIRNGTQSFAAYRYDLPEMSITVENRKKAIGRQEQYFAGKYKTDELAPHFATFYGGDIGEVVYDTGNTERPNLMILCNSYGCSVRQLVSTHFNRTYVVDMREYMTQKGHGMKLHSYLEENHIDMVLILGDISYFLYGKMPH